MIKLGREVVDRVSGFRGIAVSSTTYVYGRNRVVAVQPKVQKDNFLPEMQVFDEYRLKEVKTPLEKKAGFRKQS